MIVGVNVANEKALIFDLVIRRYIAFFMLNYESWQVNINSNIDSWKDVENILHDKEEPGR